MAQCQKILEGWACLQKVAGSIPGSSNLRPLFSSQLALISVSPSSPMLQQQQVKGRSHSYKSAVAAYSLACTLPLAKSGWAGYSYECTLPRQTPGGLVTVMCAPFPQQSLGGLLTVMCAPFSRQSLGGLAVGQAQG